MAQFRGGMNELMRQAARMQRKIEQAKTDAKDREVVGEALGGKVKATVTLGRLVKRIELDPEFVKSEGIELALDGACVALNQALEQADKAMEVELEKVTGGVKIPGMV
jgi:DNA-binding protein YbaB